MKSSTETAYDCIGMLFIIKQNQYWHISNKYSQNMCNLDTGNSLVQGGDFCPVHITVVNIWYCSRTIPPGLSPPRYYPTISTKDITHQGIIHQLNITTIR